MRHLLAITVVGAVLAGCALPHTRVIVPPDSLKSDTTLGYQTELDRHDIRLGAVPPQLVEHWTAMAFPFGQLRHSKWQGEFAFTSDVWFPLGLPTVKGERCGVQSYDGIKVEGGKWKEFEATGRPWIPLEFHPIEQHAFRVKCDLDAQPSRFNMAGY